MTLSDIRTEARQELDDTSSTAADNVWTDAELNSYINDGCLLIQQLTEWHQDIANLVMVAAQQNYTLPTNQLRLMRVTFDRKFLPQTTHWELDRDNPQWREATSNDPVIRWFLPQWDTLSAYPKPATAGTSYTFDSEVGLLIAIYDGATPDGDWSFDSEFGIIIQIADSAGGQWVFYPDIDLDPFTTFSAELGTVYSLSSDETNIGLFFIRLPDTLTADTQSPQMPSFVHPALVPYAVYRALIREGPRQDQKLAQQYFADFADWMDRVLQLQGRRFPESVLHLEAIEPGSMFENRLAAIGGPSVIDLKPSYS